MLGQNQPWREETESNLEIFLGLIAQAWLLHKISATIKLIILSLSLVPIQVLLSPS